MHGRRRVCRSPFKTNEGSISSFNFNKTLGDDISQETKDKNKKFTDQITNFLTPDKPIEAVPFGGVASKMFKGIGGKVVGKVTDWAQGLIG